MAQTFPVTCIEQATDVLFTVRDEVPVGGIEQGNGAAHIRESRKRLTPSLKCPGSKGVAHVVDSVRDASRLQGRCPFPVTEIVQLDVAPRGAGKSRTESSLGGRANLAREATSCVRSLAIVASSAS